MPTVSDKGLQMPASPIRKLVPFAEEAKRKGRTVYHLNIGQPDIKTPIQALNAIRNFDLPVVEYSHSAGFASYREKLAAYYQGLNLPVQAEDILITTGGSEALLFGLMSCLDPGDEVVIPEPFYANYAAFAIAAGARIVPVTAHIEDGFAPTFTLGLCRKNQRKNQSHCNLQSGESHWNGLLSRSLECLA